MVMLSSRTVFALRAVAICMVVVLAFWTALAVALAKVMALAVSGLVAVYLWLPGPIRDLAEGMLDSGKRTNRTQGRRRRPRRARYRSSRPYRPRRRRGPRRARYRSSRPYRPRGRRRR